MFLPGALGAGIPLKPGQLSPPLSKAESSVLATPVYSPSQPGPWFCSSGFTERRPPRNPGSRTQKEAGSKAFIWQGTHLGQGSTGWVGGVRCAHRQEVPEFLTCQVGRLGAERGRVAWLASWILTLPSVCGSSTEPAS